MTTFAYPRFPTLAGEQIVFTAEDDLWLVGTAGGNAERLTAGVALATHARFSPDGQQIAFIGRDEGPEEVYVMPVAGGPATRLTFQGAQRVGVTAWTPDGQRIVYATHASQPSPRMRVLYSIAAHGGEPSPLGLGLAQQIAYGPQGAVVLGRNIGEMAFWKRYRGGTAGYLWIDPQGNGDFHRLLELRGNMSHPCWVGNRIVFLADHEGMGDVYSCLADGSDLRRHTRQIDYYARGLASDGQRCVFHAGGELYLLDPLADQLTHVPVTLRTGQAQMARRFVATGKYLDTVALHPRGQQLAITVRGKAFTLGAFQGAVSQLGEPDATRYRYLQWLADGKRQVAVADDGDEPRLAVLADGAVRRLDTIDIGHVVDIAPAPAGDLVALVNHRNEILLIDVAAATMRVLDHSDCGRNGLGSVMRGVAWSPDARWLAYAFALTPRQTVIKLAEVATGTTTIVTTPVRYDGQPAFDPQGRYLYFIGTRTFEPVKDSMQFAFSFPKGQQIYLITLRRDLSSPLDPLENEPIPPAASAQTPDADKADDQKAVGEAKKTPEVQVDLEGIVQRIAAFPLPEGRYGQVVGTPDGILFTSLPILSQHESEGGPGTPTEGKATLQSFSFAKRKAETLAEGVGEILITADGQMLAYRTGEQLRVGKAGEKFTDGSPGKESGWVDLDRVRVSVQPRAEWRQMFAEAWRLEREQFWVADMSGVDWPRMRQRYAPLVDRLGSRSEFSDLLWEFQGELGTSHTYEFGGEYRPGPNFGQGFLGVDWAFDPQLEEFRIARIVEGDPWRADATSPLLAPGVNVRVGDTVLAINGQTIGSRVSPQQLLVNQAGQPVELMVRPAGDQTTRSVTVRAQGSEFAARYRDWVEANRRWVHEQSQGQVGYLHIPDMWMNGFNEFHRYFLVEYDYPSLIVDVRFNGGGAVSGLVLEKLARRRVGYDFQRWGPPEPYTGESPRGPLVALTNEHAGSDGDIFCHSFKMLGLGPVIGMRTWGGVIGIEPYIALADGTVMSQPEFSFWFKDVGWGVENYGTDPTITVDIRPQDYARGTDPQLERALAESLRLLTTVDTATPDPGPRPNLRFQREATN